MLVFQVRQIGLLVLLERRNDLWPRDDVHDGLTLLLQILQLAHELRLSPLEAILERRIALLRRIGLLLGVVQIVDQIRGLEQRDLRFEELLGWISPSVLEKREQRQREMSVERGDETSGQVVLCSSVCTTARPHRRHLRALFERKSACET